MQDIYQQRPGPERSGGYRPLISTGITRNSESSFRDYLAAVAGLGLMLGAVTAFTGCRTHTVAAAKPSNTASTHPSGSTSLPAVSSAPAPPLPIPIESLKKTVASATLLKPVSVTPTKKLASAQKEHSIAKPLPEPLPPKPLPLTKVSAHRASAERPPYVSPIPLAAPRPRAVPPPPAAPKPPTALDQAAAAGPFFLAIEGELTVASYDESAGTIGTYEGSNFVLDPAAGADDGIPWPDFPFDIHYRCEESGNCILVRGSATAKATVAR